MYLVVLRKTLDTPQAAEYAYGPSEEGMGRLRLDKTSGEISLLEVAPGDNDQALFTRAAWKIEEHWEEGQLPEETCWAS